jgi:hypothetical protein
MTIFGFGANQTKFQLAALNWLVGTTSTRSSNWKATDVTLTSDATVVENYNFNAEISKFPVQGGYPVTDMAGTTGFSVTITAVNSNSSAGILDAISDPVQFVGNTPLGTIFTDIITRVQETYNTLEKWANRGTPLELRTVYAKEGYLEANGKIAPFLISSLNIIRNQDSGDSIGWSCVLDRVFISETSLLESQGVIQLKGQQGMKTASKAVAKNKADPLGAMGEVEDNLVQGSGSKYEDYSKSAAKAVTNTPQ